MDIIGYLQSKYPEHKVKYLPQTNCRACHGSGEITQKSTGELHLCICTCVRITYILICNIFSKESEDG